ncbi:putative tail fiber protein [Aeromonas phage ZPAH34]|uniref:virion structural protein n=1 Tax=Aeromonas phage ZPAH34 TaxID=2924888 RepID=UPI0023297595|nr:virion structural protein [Aeromonas phage ZPAH34]UOX39576.1 putative tail fiber protein [Aeromonas phage ZPAH34]
MANDIATSVGQLIYPWNPFNDNPENEIKDELVHVEPNPKGVVFLPRKGPFFTTSFKVFLKDSGRELRMETGDFSFVYPFGAFIRRYSQLVYGGIQVHNVTDPTNLVIEYNTIGADFVLDDIAYAEAVATIITSPRRADWNQIVNIPLVFPPDPHDHPASDTIGYDDMLVAMQSYIDAVASPGNPESLQALIERHLEADLRDAHKATLADLGLEHLKDWEMVEHEELLTSESSQLLMNVNATKYLIRSYAQGLWN